MHYFKMKYMPYYLMDRYFYCILFVNKIHFNDLY